MLLLFGVLCITHTLGKLINFMLPDSFKNLVFREMDGRSEAVNPLLERNGVRISRVSYRRCEI
jgi:hypothetical protein